MKSAIAGYEFRKTRRKNKNKGNHDKTYSLFYNESEKEVKS